VVTSVTNWTVFCFDRRWSRVPGAAADCAVHRRPEVGSVRHRPLQDGAFRYYGCMEPVRGRPRSPAADAAVSRAVLELLDRVGYTAMSVEQVAVSAGVAKATIYRRWASKAEMVFGIVVHGETIETPAVTGALAGDLAALVRRVVTLLSAPAARQALPGLLADLRRDPLLAERFQATVIQSQREVVAAILQRAVARGELGGQPDAAAVHAQLLGTVFGWLHLTFSDPPDDLAEQVTDALLAALQARNQP
jgi:AcrR family transcriptional regulator